MDPVLGRCDPDYLMGHQRKKDMVIRSYYQPDMQALRILYKQHMSLVTITEQIKFQAVTDDRLMELEQKILQLRNDLDHATGIKQMEDDSQNNKK